VITSIALTDVRINDDLMSITWADGETTDVPILWLRDSCPCPACLHPSGQRLLEIVRIADEVAVDRTRLTGTAVEVRWLPDGHLSRYPAAMLRTPAPAEHTTPSRRTGGGRALRWHQHEAVAASGSARRQWLADVVSDGFGLLRGVPDREGEVVRVAQLFGYVRITNYGRLFDVRSVVDPGNLAFTSLALGLHTDNPYRAPAPTLQLLHCLRSAGAGGETILVDGFRVAEAMALLDPSGFLLLSTTPVRFRYADATADLVADSPVIERDARGNIIGIRYNTRSICPPRNPPAESAAWYEAYLTFARLLDAPEVQVRIALRPGELVLMDNRRTLHGRTGFEAATGERHLQGCYADIDGLLSELAVLSRTEPR
jgi:gamma-butyrobetaine dioxygenase